MLAKDYCRMTDDEARTYLEKLRWPDGPVCPHRGSLNAVALNGKATRPGVHKCRDCRKQFTVTVGTIFERSHLPLNYWLYAFARMCASKKGISAKQLERELGISYKGAWFMCHRIRHAMLEDPTMLTGSVEVDETYVGGKPKKGDGKVHKRGRGTKKTPVVALVERGGNVRTRVVCDVTAKTLREAITDHVEKGTTIVTDEFRGYLGIGEVMGSEHKSVNHSSGVYGLEDGTNTNTVESFFALLKRGVYGTYHYISKKHLQRYCDEFAFRWNYRMGDQGEITAHALKGASGKRLVYSSVVSSGNNKALPTAE